MARREEGYTLVELVVAVLMFAVAMTVISVSFNRIVANSGQVMKSVETDIGGLIGLELFRVDLGYAGFGLPWSLGSATYSEANPHLVDGIVQTDAASFNDSPNRPPRAFVMLNDKGLNRSDYLVLKGTALGMKQAARRWSYLGYSSVGAVVKPPKSEVELIPGEKDRVIVIDDRSSGGVSSRELKSLGRQFVLSFDKPESIKNPFRPRTREDRYLVYGLMPPPEDSDDDITFPFNRADYYIGSSDTLSSNCSPGTGALMRGMVTQKGNFRAMPILDCVADLQVVFKLDTSNDGSLVSWTLDEYALDRQLEGEDVAAAIRDHVKKVQVFILAQAGKKDTTYSYPVTDPARVFVLGDAHGRTWSAAELTATLGRDWRHYRWKIYTIAVQPGNLN